MGTWGTGLFDDDVAMDVRDCWIDQMQNLAVPPAAAAEVTEQLRHYVDDEDDAPAFWFALVALELEHGWVGAWEAERADALIDTNLEALRERGASIADLREREQILLALRQRMHAVRSGRRAETRELAGLAALNTEPTDDHALTVHLRSVGGKLDLSALERRLSVAMSTAGGAYDGHEVAVDGSEVVLYMHGSDADALFEAAEPTLLAISPGHSSFAVKRYGGAEGAVAREVRVQLG